MKIKSRNRQNTYLKSEDRSKRDLSTAVEMMDVCDERKRRSYPAVGAHSSTVHPTEQRVQGNGACSQRISADLMETFSGAFQIKAGLLVRAKGREPLSEKIDAPAE